MNLETLRFEESGDVATIWLAQDLINMRLIRELTAVCDHLEDQSTAQVVVLRGIDGRFCHGLDFAEFRQDQPIDIHGFNKWEKMCSRLERLPKISIAVAEGPVIGGGALGLLLACDARIGSPSMRIQLTEVKMGFLPGMSVFRLAKYIGLGRAKRLIMQCREVDAKEAVEMGIIDEVSDNLERAIVDTIACFTPVRPVPVQLARRLLNESFASDFENFLGSLLAAQQRAIGQETFLNTVRKKKSEIPPPRNDT